VVEGVSAERCSRGLVSLLTIHDLNCLGTAMKGHRTYSEEWLATS